jgi:hypothetical protein
MVRGKLRDVLVKGDPKSDKIAKDIAARGPKPSLAATLFGDVVNILGAPRRIIQATATEGLEHVPGLGLHDDKRSWWGKYTDPGYGWGTFLQDQGIVNITDKSSTKDRLIAAGLGLSGDIALDPFSYLSAGATPALKAAGKSGGLTADLLDVAQQAGKGTERANLASRLATKAAKGAYKLNNAELDQAAYLTGRETGAFRYGLGVRATPFTETAKVLESEGAVGQIGRTVAQASDKAKWVVGKIPVPAGSYGHNLSQLFESRQTLMKRVAAELPGVSEDEATRLVSRLGSGLDRGSAQQEAALRDWTQEWSSLADDAKKVIPNGEEYMDLVRTHPTRQAVEKDLTKTLGEEAVAGMDDAAKSAAMDTAWEKHIPDEATRDIIRRHVDLQEKIRTEFGSRSQIGQHGGTPLPDAAERGRPFAPRIMHEDMTEVIGGTRDRSPLSGKAWFEKAGLSPYANPDTEAGRNLAKFKEMFGIDPVPPGEALPDGTRAPALEVQFQEAVDNKFGDKAKQWYVNDMYEAMPRYIKGVAHQTGNKTTENYLAWKEISHALGETKIEPHMAVQEVGGPNPAAGGSWGKPVADMAVGADGAHVADVSKWNNHLFLPTEHISDTPMGKLLAGVMPPMAATGKPVDKALLDQLNTLLRDPAAYLADMADRGVPEARIKAVREASEMVSSVNDQFTQRANDAMEATAKREAAEAEFAAAKPGTQARSVARVKVAALAKAEEAYAAREAALTPADGQIAHLEGKYQEGIAAIAGHNTEDALLAVDERKFAKVLWQGHEGFGYNRQIPTAATDILDAAARRFDPVTGEGMRAFLRHVDPLNNWMKSNLVSSFGFLLRNSYGGWFNNWLADVDMTNHARWGNTMVRYARGTGSFGDNAMVYIADDAGVVGIGQTASEAAGGVKASWNPFAGTRNPDKTFIWNYGMRKLNTQGVEPWLRGTLVYDRMTKALEQGRFLNVVADDGTKYAFSSLKDVTSEAHARALQKAVKDSNLLDNMISDVYKYHFNYDDISRFERNVVKRVLPFYTWTRKNVPLQLEMMATDPGRTVNLYMNTKRNLESTTPIENIVPGYFGETNMARLPFTYGGNRVYGEVDLPFQDPFKVMDVRGQLVGMLNPLIKAPIESAMGKELWSDVPLTDKPQAVPGTWAAIPGFMQALSVAGKTMPFLPFDGPVKGQGGKWYMSGKDQHLLQQYVPQLYTMQRLAPIGTEDAKGKPSKYQRRFLTSWLSWMGGVNVRTNTPQDQESEMYRRYEALKGMDSRLSAIGYTKQAPQAPRQPGELTGLANMTP